MLKCRVLCVFFAELNFLYSRFKDCPNECCEVIIVLCHVQSSSPVLRPRGCCSLWFLFGGQMRISDGRLPQEWNLDALIRYIKAGGNQVGTSGWFCQFLDKRAKPHDAYSCFTWDPILVSGFGIEMCRGFHVCPEVHFWVRLPGFQAWFQQHGELGASY